MKTGLLASYVLREIEGNDNRGMATSLRKLNNFKLLLCVLLPKNLSQQTICEQGESVEALEEPQAIIISIQSVHQDTGQIWETLESIELAEAHWLL